MISQKESKLLQIVAINLKDCYIIQEFCVSMWSNTKGLKNLKLESASRMEKKHLWNHWLLTFCNSMNMCAMPTTELSRFVGNHNIYYILKLFLDH